MEVAIAGSFSSAFRSFVAARDLLGLAVDERASIAADFDVAGTAKT